MASNAQSRSRRDHSLWDKAINEQWGGLRPILSPEESLAAAKKLYRHAMGIAWSGKWELTSGRRRTWPRWREDGNRMVHVFFVNHEKGLRDIVHLISHYCHRRLHRYDKPHSIRQVRLEAKLTKFAISRRWHEGTLKKEPTPEAEATQVESPMKPDKVHLRYRRMVARRDKWRQELDRSKRLFAKAEAEVRGYERRHGERLN